MPSKEANTHSELSLAVSTLRIWVSWCEIMSIVYTSVSLHPLEHLHTTNAQSLFFRWMNLWMNEQLWILVSKYCFVYNYRKNGCIAQRCPLKTNLFEQQFNYIKSNCPLLYYRPNPIPTEISICILKAWLQLTLNDFPVDSFLMAEK